MGGTSDSAEECEDEEGFESDDDLSVGGDASGPLVRLRRRRRQPRQDAEELRLRGRRALCKSITDIAPIMLKTVKVRLLTRYLDSVRGLEEDDLTEIIKKNAAKLGDRTRILTAFNTADSDVNRGNLKAISFSILLQEETYSIGENRLDEKVAEYEKDLVKRSKTLDFFDQTKHDAERWHQYDTYRIVFEAAWSNDNVISPDEARLLAVLRGRYCIPNCVRLHQRVGESVAPGNQRGTSSRGM